MKALAVGLTNAHLTHILPDRIRLARLIPMSTVKSLSTVLSTKGQVILPKSVREDCGWKPGLRLSVERTAEGVTLKPEPIEPRRPPSRIEDVFGMLKSDGPPISDDEMSGAIGRHLAERWERFERTGSDYGEEEET